MPAPLTDENEDAAPTQQEQAPVRSSRRHDMLAPLPPDPHSSSSYNHHLGVTHVSSSLAPSITIHHSESDEIEVSANLPEQPEQAPTARRRYRQRLLWLPLFFNDDEDDDEEARTAAEWRTDPGKLEKLATFFFLQGSVCFLTTWGVEEQRASDNNDDDNHNTAEIMVVLAYISWIAFALLQLLVDSALPPLASDRHFAHTLYGTLGRPLNMLQSAIFVIGAVLQAVGWSQLLHLQAQSQEQEQQRQRFDNLQTEEETGNGVAVFSSIFNLEQQQHSNNAEQLERAASLNLLGCLLWDLNVLMVLVVFRSGLCCGRHGKRYGWGNFLFGLACASLTLTATWVWMQQEDSRGDEGSVDLNDSGIVAVRWVSSGLLLLTSLVYITLDEVSSCFQDR